MTLQGYSVAGSALLGGGLFGIGATIRTCLSSASGDLSSYVCGPGALTSFEGASHAHCAGCVLMALGAAVLAATAIRSIGRVLGFPASRVAVHG